MRVSYTEARARLAHVLDVAETNREPVFIERRGHEDVALVAASELTGLLETAHLVRSPANAQRLFRAIRRALGDGGKPRTVDSVRDELGLRERPAPAGSRRVRGRVSA